MQEWHVAYDAQRPDDPSATWRIGIHRQLLSAIHDAGHTYRLWQAKLIELVISPPEQLFRGWGRNKDECYVYCGHPDIDYLGPGRTSTPPPGKSFLVFVLPDGSIDDWGWRALNSETGLPSDMLGSLIWPQ